MMTYTKQQEKPPKVQKSPWIFSSSKFTPNKPPKSALPSSSSADKLPQLAKEQKSRYSDPVQKSRSQEYIPRLTKYRLEHPDRFQRLSTTKSVRNLKENLQSARDVSPLRSPSKEHVHIPKWQQMTSSNALHNVPRQDSESAGGLRSHSKNNMNVTLMDIANFSPTAFDRSGPTHISDLLFNSLVDVQRFRKMLKEPEDETYLTEKNVKERVNFCDEEKTKRIHVWLEEIEKERRMNGLCMETVEENIEYEDNSSKWNLKKYGRGE